jgi:hypothetical protein
VAVMRRFRLRRAHRHACSCSCSNSPLHLDVSTCEGRTAAVAAPAQGRDRHIGAPASDLEHDAPCICISAQAGQRLPAGRAALSRSREPRRRRERARLVVRRQPVARPTISMAPHLRMSAMCRMRPCLGASLVGSVSAVSCQVGARIFARRHVIWANGRPRMATDVRGAATPLWRCHVPRGRLAEGNGPAPRVINEDIVLALDARFDPEPPAHRD